MQGGQNDLAIATGHDHAGAAIQQNEQCVRSLPLFDDGLPAFETALDHRLCHLRGLLV